MRSVDQVAGMELKSAGTEGQSKAMWKEQWRLREAFEGLADSRGRLL